MLWYGPTLNNLVSHSFVTDITLTSTLIIAKECMASYYYQIFGPVSDKVDTLIVRLVYDAGPSHRREHF